MRLLQQVRAIAVLTALVLMYGAVIAAWVTHVVVCIKSASWILLAFGCLVAPVGAVHGAGIWLGIF